MMTYIKILLDKKIKLKNKSIKENLNIFKLALLEDFSLLYEIYLRKRNNIKLLKINLFSNYEDSFIYFLSKESNINSMYEIKKALHQGEIKLNEESVRKIDILNDGDIINFNDKQYWIKIIE